MTQEYVETEIGCISRAYGFRVLVHRRMTRNKSLMNLKKRLKKTRQRGDVMAKIVEAM